MSQIELTAHNLALAKMQIGINGGKYSADTETETLIEDYRAHYNEFIDMLEHC